MISHLSRRIGYFLAWALPGTTEVWCPGVGDFHFLFGPFTLRASSVVYYTPTGQIPHILGVDQGVEMINNAETWWDAMKMLRAYERETTPVG